MFSKRGEISTIVVLGTLAVIAVAALINATVTNQRNITNTQAAGGNCRNNPENPPDGGYVWVASCNSTCTSNTDCPKNTSDPGNVNPETSNWCYGFAEGAKCLQLQKDTGNNPTPETGNQTTNPTTQPVATTNAICDKPEGCGGACNTGLNNGCGYGGCRAWEQCVNNTCIDTTNLGTQEAGSNACRDLASATSPQNSIPTSSPTAAVNNGSNTGTTPTTSPNTTDGRCTYMGDVDCITLTPKPNITDGRCTYIGDVDCIALTPRPTMTDGKCTYIGDTDCITLTPSSTRTSVYLQNNTQPTPTPTRVSQQGVTPSNTPLPNKLTPSPTPTRNFFTATSEILAKSCTQDNKTVITAGCILEAGLDFFNVSKP